MHGSPLEVAIFFPRITVLSGGVERWLKLIEHSDSANISYTAFVASDSVRNATAERRLQGLAREGKLNFRPLRPSHADDANKFFDAIMIPSEFWIPALNKAKAAGIRAPTFIEFQLLPYIGGFDVLKAVGIDNPGPLDVLKFPFVSARILGESVRSLALQTAACVHSVRSIGRLRNNRLMAATPVVSKHLAALGFAGDVYIPHCYVGIEPDLVGEATRDDGSATFDAVYVGRILPHKGLDLPLIAAHMKKLLGREIRIAVCGSPDLPKHEAMFQARIRSLGVEKNLTMLGWLDHERLYSTMRAAKALLYPSYVDSFSIAVLESLCLGVPVIGYGIDALKMVWGSRDAVFTSQVGNPMALALLYASLETDSRLEEARKAARRQSRTLLEQYTWENAVRSERMFYEGHRGDDGGWLKGPA